MKYFTIAELIHSDTATRRGIVNSPDEEAQNNLVALVDNVLDPAREWYQMPVFVTSGYRSETINTIVGGVKNSEHLTGSAADITTHDITKNKALFDYIKDNLPYNQLIWEYGGQWIHVSYNRTHNKMQVISTYWK